MRSRITRFAANERVDTVLSYDIDGMPKGRVFHRDDRIEHIAHQFNLAFEDSGVRRPTNSGRPAIVWRAVGAADAFGDLINAMQENQHGRN